MDAGFDDVSNIHRRFSLTLLNPASHYFSLVASLAIAAVSAFVIHAVYLNESNLADLWYRVVIAVVVMALTQVLDTRFTKKKEYSKSLHSSLFANMLCIVALLTGLLASMVLVKEISLFYVTLSMFLFASFRIGIYTTTLGISLRRAWAICFVQPMAVFLVVIPQDLWSTMLTEPISLAYGMIFMIIATMWSYLTDRAGRPGMESTHKTIQAYIASRGDDYVDAEKILEQRSSEAHVSTSQIRLLPMVDNKEDNNNAKNNRTEFSMVLPDIHPGPYHPVGGSNIPYLIYKNLSSSAMVMHSISDHALNLPSKNEVENYLRKLEASHVVCEGLHCTEPVTVRINKARVIGLLFGDSPLLFLSLSPHGMEDIPSYMKTEIESYATNRGYSKVIIVDCHNAMGDEISIDDGEDMIKAVKSCLDSLMAKKTFPIEFGYANSDGMDVQADDLGMGGLGIVCIRINNKKYFVGWADSNNMENGVREKIIDHLAQEGYNLLEICTSDTHYSRVKVRNKNGYYQLGLITSDKDLSNWFLQMASRAQKNTISAKFEILENKANVRVMGTDIFEDYSRALENALKITKWFALGGTLFFITGLLFL